MASRHVPPKPYPGAHLPAAGLHEGIPHCLPPPCSVPFRLGFFCPSVLHILKQLPSYCVCIIPATHTLVSAETRSLPCKSKAELQRDSSLWRVS